MIRRALHLRQMLRNEKLPIEVLVARQRRALNELVRYAGHRVPFYRDLYRSRGIDVSGFDTARDLQALPVVDKQQLRAAGSDALSLDAPPDRVTISTSGSTGEPFTFQIDRDYDQWRKAQYLRPYLRNGRRTTDKILRLTAFPSSRRPWFTRLGLLREWQLDCGLPAEEIASAWHRLSPDILQAYPSSLRSLAHFCLENPGALTPAPRLVFTDSEMLTADARALFKRAFQAPVFDIFGTYETDNVLYQCAAQDGYHVAIDCFMLEILRDGRPVQPGESGEMVVTVLENRTTPFIRYNLRDIGKFSPELCPCGSPFPVVTGIRGRADDLILLDGGKTRSSMDILGRLDGYWDRVQHYQLRQLELHCFELLIVPGFRFTASDREQMAQTIRPLLPNALLEIKIVDAIPAQRSGKRLAFISALKDKLHA